MALVKPVVTPAIAKAAEALTFVGQGGPLVVLDAADADRWWGTLDEAGKTAPRGTSDFETIACQVEGEVELAALSQRGGAPAALALMLGTPDMAAFHPMPHGLLLLRWVGADTAAGLLAAALALDPDAFDPVGELVVSGELWMFEATEDARDPRGFLYPWTRISLPAGRYAVSASQEWEGFVQGPAGDEEVMVSALRFRST